MGMSIGRSGNRVSDRNRTAMTDVLLVLGAQGLLLVMFTIAQPMLQPSVDEQMPVPAKAPTKIAVDTRVPPIVLEIMPDGSYRLNTQPFPKNRLKRTLTEVFSGRASKVMYLKWHEGVRSGDVKRTLDITKGVGVQVLGIFPPGT